MAYLGQGIAFASLVLAATCLETNNINASGLWVLVVFWVIFTDWYPKK